MDLVMTELVDGPSTEKRQDKYNNKWKRKLIQEE